MSFLFRLLTTPIRWGWKSLVFIKDLFFIIVTLAILLFAAAVISQLNANKNNLLQEGALLLNISGSVVEESPQTVELRSIRKTLLGMGSKYQQENSLFTIIDRIRQAKDDEKITGIVLQLDQLSAISPSSLDYVSKTLEDFKQSGKRIYSIGQHYSQSQYYLASFADKIYLPPNGSTNIIGFASQNLYYKSLLEKLAVNTHVFRVGTYKSAVEPYLRDSMSDEAKENNQRWLDKLWNSYASQVTSNRQLDINESSLVPDIDTYIQRLKLVSGSASGYAVKYGLVDEIRSLPEMDAMMQEEFGVSKNNTFKYVNFLDYTTKKVDKNSTPKVKTQIGVIVVNGAIASGVKGANIADADSIVVQLRQARSDKNIKGIILHVNSPGGGVNASEMIRAEVDALTREGKPVVISMGGMAASGGYWIATAGDYIIANANTLTGSIGIFAVLNTFENSLAKIGAYTDGVSTSTLAATNLFSRLDPKVAESLQIKVENGYNQFLELVAKSRDQSIEDVNRIAQGQIWLGSEAKEIGLVDEIGNFDDAITKILELTKLEQGQFRLHWFNDEISFFQMLFGQMSASMQTVVSASLQSFIPKSLLDLAQSVTNQDELFSLINDPNQYYVYCETCSIPLL